MKGLWRWPDDDDGKSALQLLGRPHIVGVLSALKKSGKGGLSNAQIDALLKADSQWLIFWDMRELIALGLVKYEVHLFGEPGKYLLTETGAAFFEEDQKRTGNMK